MMRLPTGHRGVVRIARHRYEVCHCIVDEGRLATASYVVGFLDNSLRTATRSDIYSHCEQVMV